MGSQSVRAEVELGRELTQSPACLSRTEMSLIPRTDVLNAGAREMAQWVFFESQTL